MIFGEISVQLMGFYCNLCRFVAKSVIHAVMSRNFCHNLCAFMWRKIKPKSTFVEKKKEWKWKYEVWLHIRPVICIFEQHQQIINNTNNSLAKDENNFLRTIHTTKYQQQSSTTSPTSFFFTCWRVLQSKLLNEPCNTEYW